LLFKVRRSTAAAALLTLVFGLAGCGGEPTAPSPAAKNNTTPAPAATEPIKVGASLSLTGQYERTGKDLQQAYDLWVEHVNAKGGLMGRKVDLKVYDDQSQPETAAKLYEKLITDDKVDLLMGPYSTAVTLTATTATEKAKFPMLAAGASGSQIWGRGYKYVFGFYSQAPTYSDGALEMAKAKGHKTVALVNEDTAFPIDVVKGAEAKAKALGLEVVFAEKYAKGTTDFSTLVAKLKAKNPDVLIGGTYLPDSTGIIRAAKDAGWTAKLMFFTVGPALPDFGKNMGKDAAFILGNTEWESIIKAPGIDKFIADYTAKYKTAPGYHAAGGYASGQVLEAVVEKAKSLDREKLREAYATVETETVFGPYKVDAEGRQVGKPNFMIQWQDDKRQVVWPEKFATAPAQLPVPAWNSR
jgi:branched-chain amino acid transport system substrate-binding protein